jgi:ankyrin repeat protein
MERWLHRIVIWCLVFVIFCPACAHAQRPESNEVLDSARVRTDNVPVYYKMSLDSPLVKKLNRGDSVTIELKIQDEDGEWCGIREKGQTAMSGFVLCENLEDEGFTSGEGRSPGEIIGDMPELIRASGQGDIATVRKLLEKGAHVNTRDNESGWTPLMAAALSGNTDIVKLLVRRKADVNAQEKFSWTPLMIASRSGHSDIVRVLLEAGAGVNAKTSTGYTALMAAAKQGHAEIVELLLARGADVHARDQLGWRAVTLAERNGHEDIVEMLKKEESWQ